MSYTKTPAARSYLQFLIGTVYTNVPGVEGIPEFGPEKKEYENTAISDSTKTYGQDLPDPGDLVITGSWDSQDATHAGLLASAANVSAVADGFKVVYHSNATATFSAFVMSFRTSAQKGADEKFSTRLKLSGAVTYAART